MGPQSGGAEGEGERRRRGSQGLVAVKGGRRCAFGLELGVDDLEAVVRVLRQRLVRRHRRNLEFLLSERLNEGGEKAGRRQERPMSEIAGSVGLP